MKYLVKIFVIMFITICSTTSKSENISIVYIDIDKVMNQTIAGKSIKNQLEKIHDSNIKFFKETEAKLKSEESDLISKKNILSNDEYIKTVNLLKKKINEYKKNRKTKIESVNKRKADATALLLKELNPILADFSKKNNISIILRKKDLIIARSDLEITNQIIELFNSKVKKIKLN
tara:strand:- start:13 stop:540 length:528 start_codon:yes stop_codon:yes gene_type:complete